MMIRPLKQNDAPAWRELRIRMLTDHPGAYGEHIEDFAQRNDAGVLEMMLDGNVHGAILNEKLVGAAGWFPERGKNRAHVGLIWGMYVTPEARGSGIGKALLETLIAQMRAAGRRVVQLAVAEDNTEARRLYERAGFVVWGREPDALCVNGVPGAELHMSRRLR